MDVPISRFKMLCSSCCCCYKSISRHLSYWINLILKLYKFTAFYFSGYTLISYCFIQNPAVTQICAVPVNIIRGFKYVCGVIWIAEAEWNDFTVATKKQITGFCLALTLLLPLCSEKPALLLMNLKLLRVTLFWSCSEKQKAKLCFCWNQKIYEDYKPWLAWLFEHLEVQSVAEHPRPAVSLELFTYWLLWNYLQCSVPCGSSWGLSEGRGSLCFQDSTNKTPRREKRSAHKYHPF